MKMTKEEAIQALDKERNEYIIRGCQLDKAIDLAIDALSKPSGDLIRRQDALKPFCTAPDGTRIPEVDCDNFPVEFSVEFIKKHLLSLPSAETKTGVWILQDTSYWRATSAGDVQVNRVNLKCSLCGWRNHEKKNYNYCPHCGAVMRGIAE